MSVSHRELPDSEALSLQLIADHGKALGRFDRKGGVDLNSIAQDLGFKVERVRADSIGHKHGELDLEDMVMRVDRRLGKVGRKQVLATLVAHSMVDLDDFLQAPELKLNWIRSFANQLTMPAIILFPFFASGATPGKIARTLVVTRGQLAMRLDELGLLG